MPDSTALPPCLSPCSYSYQALIETLGPMEYSAAYNASGLLDAGVAGALTVRADMNGVFISFSASFSFLGLAVSGAATLSTSGGIESAAIYGSGTVGIPELAWLPLMTGDVSLVKQGTFSPAVLSMSVSMSFLGLSLEGSVTFTAFGGIQSLHLQASASVFNENLKAAIIKAASGGSTDSNNIFVRGFTKALEGFVVNTMTLTNDGGVFLIYTFDLVILGTARTLQIKLPTVPTSLSDLAELIAEYGDDIIRAIAPIDISVQLGDADRTAQLCGPSVCICGVERKSCRRKLTESGEDITPVVDTPPLRFDEHTPAVYLSDRRKLLFCGIQFTECCHQLCASSPIDFEVQARLHVAESAASMDFDAKITFGGDSALIGSWDGFSKEYSHSVVVGYGSGTSLCDVVPSVGDFIRNHQLGGGEKCATVLGISGCVDMPSFRISSVIDCDSAALTL